MRDFINYNQALELKELGFDEPCFVKVWWLNSTNRHTKESYKPEITMNGQDIKFDYPIPEKHPLSEFDVLDLQVPTFSQAFRFFRDKKLSDSCICRYQGRNDGGIYYYYVINHDFGIEETKHYKEGFLSYEEAESACLDKLIELAKTK